MLGANFHCTCCLLVLPSAVPPSRSFHATVSLLSVSGAFVRNRYHDGKVYVSLSVCEQSEKRAISRALWNTFCKVLRPEALLVTC